MILWNNIALIEDDAYFTKWVKETGRLDHHQGFLKALAPYVKGTVLDIGANIGTHTIFYARNATKVIAFEPNQVAYECLEYKMKAFPNVTLFKAAVSNHEAMVDIIPQGDNYGAVYTVPGTTVPTITIDSLQLDSCNYMKIDVEGDELAVLLGGKDTIAKFKPVMCIECNEHTLQRKGMDGNHLISYIHSLGYTTTVRKPEDISCDLICLPNAPT
jgi:FkbM family methyltransferase